MISEADHKKYFYGLDSLRFLAFLGVFLSHTLRWQPTGKIANLLFTLITFDYFGVYFFFTLSGFLITFNLLSEKIKYGEINLLRFYTNRSLRIWPVYFTMVLFYFFLLPQAAGLFQLPPPTLAPITPFLFFYVNFYVIAHGNNFSIILLILWSISIQEQFYFFWGAVFRYVKLTLFIYVLLVLLIFSIIFSYYYAMLNRPALSIHTFYVMQNFIPGAALAWIYLRQKTIYHLLTKIPSAYIMIAYVILPLAYINWFDINMIPLNIIKSICFAIVIYEQALNPNCIFHLGKFPIINYLGKISYGLYIYHALVIVFMQKTFHFFDSASQPSLLINIVQSLTAYLITVLIAHLSYKYFESKFLAIKIRKEIVHP